MTDANIPVVLRGLSKRYKGTAKPALDNVSLTVGAGEVYGFLGPNGAGKSTTIRTLLNFIQPTSGSANILGLDIVRDSVAIKRSIGYIAGDVGLYGQMTGRQFLHYMAALQPPKHPGYLPELTQHFAADMDKRITDLSKGNRQKLSVIQALMHEPEILILDEPTSGLDPLMQEVFYSQIAAAKARGASVFFSSHDLAEVQKICDRVGFIREGRLISEQTIADLKQHAAHTFDVTFHGKAPLAELKALKKAKLQTLDHNRVSVRIGGDLSPLFAVLAKYPVDTFEQREINLEEEFLQLYKVGVNGDSLKASKQAAAHQEKEQ
jgi:ABC-2 type transport system ATP-binding protein